MASFLSFIGKYTTLSLFNLCTILGLVTIIAALDRLDTLLRIIGRLDTSLLFSISSMLCSFPPESLTFPKNP